MFRLLDEAEEQEIREVLLAYFYLWRYAGERGWTTAELDDYIELDLERRLKLNVDFEVADAIRKLVSAGIVDTTDENRYAPHPSRRPRRNSMRLWVRYAQDGHVLMQQEL